MRKILITLAIAMTSIAAASAYNTNLGNGNNVIFCKCSKAILRKCRVNQIGPICAQSKPGQNIDCWDYDYNCK